MINFKKTDFCSIYVDEFMEKKLGYSFYHLEILRLCGVGNGHDWSIFFCFIKGVFGRKVDNWKVS